MKPLRLSICICSLHERAELLARLLDCLAKQNRIDECQILINVDAGQQTIGVKRNYMVNDSLGAYVVHIDDDDLVHPSYVELVLIAIESNPGVHAIAIRGRRVDTAGQVAPVEFDYRLMSPTFAEGDKDGVIWRSPGHLCPIRSDIARSTMFPETEPEDLPWVAEVGPKIATLARAGSEGMVLYSYLWDSKKMYRWDKAK